MKVTYLGHACVNIDINGTHFLVDPFISPNPLASHIDINSIKADYILITHAHGDHRGYCQTHRCSTDYQS